MEVIMNRFTKSSYLVSSLALIIIALILMILFAFSLSFSFDTPTFRPMPTPIVPGTQIDDDLSTP
jgi:hypothetical protein